MSDFFSLDSPLYKFMSRLLQMLKLNVLWLLTGGLAGVFIIEYVLALLGLSQYRFISFLPLIMVGPATVAVFSITLRMVDEQEGYIAHNFFNAYRENLKKGMILGIIADVAVYAIWLDFQFFYAAEKLHYNSLGYLIVGIVTTAFVFMHLVYAFPLQARYENTVINTLRNSFSISLKYIVKTVFMFIILALLCAIFMWNFVTQFLGILIGPACIMLAISGFASQSFRLIENDNKEREE